MTKKETEKKVSHTFTVDRSKWRCGGANVWDCKKAPWADIDPSVLGQGGTFLRNRQGYKCCLGFVAEQLGAKGLTDKEFPRTVHPTHKKKLEGVLTYEGNHTVLTVLSMRINDSNKINKKQRESQLRELFKEHGHRMKFVGKYERKSK